MDPREHLFRVYRDLADWYERQRQPQMRDRFLVLAADAALTAERPDEAERLRLRLLKVNPHHMLKPYGSFTEALKAPDVLTYVKDLRVNYPPDVAEDLLRTLQSGEKGPPAGVPATAPVVDLGGSLTAPLPPAVDEGSTFFDAPGQEPDLAQTAAPGPLNAPRGRPPQPVPQTIPLQPAAPARPAAALPTRPAARPIPAHRPVPPPDARPPVSRTHEEPVAGGAWLAVLLVVVVLAAGAALTGFTFLRPYFNLPW